MPQLQSAKPFPRGALIGAAVLIGLTIVSATAARLTSTGPARPSGTIVLQRDFRFEDRADGSIAVFDARDGAAVDRLAPGTNGFVRAALRSLASRRKFNGDRNDIWHITAWGDGRLTLDDHESGGVIDLEAFGQTNEMAFARLMTEGPSSR